MSVRRWLVVVAGAIACVACVLISIRLMEVLLILQLGYGAEIPLPRWIVERTPVGFWIASMLIGGPLFLVLAIVGAWLLRSYIRRSREIQQLSS